MVIDGEAITESNAILQYAADLNGGGSAYPKDLKRRADVNRWLLWETSAWFPSCYVYLVEHIVKPLLKQEPDEAIIAAQNPKWHAQAAILDKRLSQSVWLCGDEVRLHYPRLECFPLTQHEQPTIADIAVAAPMHLHAGGQRLPLDDHPHLKRWLLEAVEKLPAWQKTQGAVDKALARPTTNGTSSEVRATFNYTKDVSPQLTELYFYETDKAKDIHEPGDDPKELAVADGWHRADSFSADKEGFSIHDFTTPFDQWFDDEAVKQQFYPEVVDFLKRTTGAKRILVFDHTTRTAKNAAKKVTQETNTSQRAPVMLVHCDYTSESGPVRVQQLLPSEADDLLKCRVAFFNVWKPLNKVEERPLAMCDVTSAPPEDFFKLHLRYRDRNGENYLMRYSPSHKWWYFPQMEADKVILLKTYESETDGRARFVGHSAFDDPNTKEGAPLRESVEIRTIAFF